MEGTSCKNQALGLRKFIPVHIRPSEPTLEKCYIPTASSAYLRITDSITSVTSLSTSAVDDEERKEFLSDGGAKVQAPPSKCDDPLAAPLSRLLVSQDYGDGIASRRKNPDRGALPPFSAAHLPAVAVGPALAHDLQEKKVPPSTLNRLLTTPSETHTPGAINPASCASCNLLGYIQQKASVEKPALQADAGDEEPSFTIASVKRSEREMVRRTKKATVDPAKPLDPYINSVNMLTALVSQNANLVKTALDAISAAAIRPPQPVVVAGPEPKPTEYLSPKKESIAVQKSDLLRKMQVTSIMPSVPEPPQEEKSHEKSKPSRIPKPETSPVSTRTLSVNINTNDDLIGVPIKASEYMPKEPAFDFLNALLADDGRDLPEIEITGGPTTTDPFLQNLVSTVSKLDEFIDDICGGVEKRAPMAPLTRPPQQKTGSGARKLMRRH